MLQRVRFLPLASTVTASSNSSISQPISVEGRLAIIEGGTPLKPAQVKATDLRAGAAMIIAALTADGTTVISNIHFIERGYEEVVEKFQQLGADIKKVYDPEGELAESV